MFFRNFSASVPPPFNFLDRRDSTNTNIIIGNACLFISVDQHSFCDSDNNRVDRDYTLHKLSGTLTPNFMGFTNLISFFISFMTERR